MSILWRILTYGAFWLVLRSRRTPPNEASVRRATQTS